MSRGSRTWLPPKLNKYELARNSLCKYFGDIYGPRWPTLLDAMEQPAAKVGRLNRHAEWSLDEITQAPIFHPTLPGCLVNLENLLARPPFADRGDRLKPYYTMNAASVRAALALEAQPDDNILDCCAAPGGKTLVFDNILSDGNGMIVANDIDADRRKRLRSVFREYLPYERQKSIQIKNMDATMWGQLESGRYDRVMLDAPCGSERHFLRSNRKQQKPTWVWSEKSSRENQALQYRLLVSALEALRPGGHLLYVTCSINPLENDAIVQKALKKKRGRIELETLSLPVGEETSQGWLILPDAADLEGPMFLSKIRRI